MAVNRQKKIFAGVAVVFFGLLAYASFDIGRRTTFPGSKGQLKERINKTYLSGDTTITDSTRKTLNH